MSTLAASAVPFIYSAVTTYSTGCEVIIVNESDLCLFHHNSIDIYGQILTGKLPTVPPIYQSSSHACAFEAGVGLVNGVVKKAPCSVLIWEIDRLSMYLIVYVYMGNIGDNAGLFALVNSEKAADAWYQDNKSKWVKYSEIPHKCDTDIYGGRYHFAGEMDNSKHCKFTIKVTEK